MTRKYIGPSVGSVKLKDIDRETFSTLHDASPTQPLRVLCHAILGSALDFATRDKGYLATNPAGSVRRPKMPEKEARYLHEEDAWRMLSLVQGTEL